jgi:hypothetical protein
MSSASETLQLAEHRLYASFSPEDDDLVRIGVIFYPLNHEIGHSSY